MSTTTPSSRLSLSIGTVVAIAATAAVDMAAVVLLIVRTVTPVIPEQIPFLLMWSGLGATILLGQTLTRRTTEPPEPTHPDAPTHDERYWSAYLRGVGDRDPRASDED